MNIKQIEHWDNLSKWTATNLFVVPTLGITRGRLNIFGLENAYIKDEVKGIDYERGVYMLFRPKDTFRFGEFLEEERSSGAVIVDEYDYRDGYTMVVYQYPRKWKEDVDIIMTGKFSQVSEGFKATVPRLTKSVVGGKEMDGINSQHKIYEGAEDLKEYWNIKYGLEFEKGDEHFSFYPEREIFTEETLKNLI